MQKQLVMRSKVIKSEIEYNEACDRIYELIHKNESEIDPESEDGLELELLSLLVEQYEKENFQVRPPDPVEAIKFRMEQMNLKQMDIAPLFGGKTRVSEVLNRKRPLTLRMITLLNKYLGIPLESLIAENKMTALEKEKKEILLKNPSIREYLSRKKNKETII
jgi:HTH-type transcriptional regulator/antitoxin HigA